jgi:menaquinone-dependent protoporphyrinogen oxidase
MIEILVAYASKHNSTADIAKEIGKVLRQSSDLHVDIRSVEVVEDITTYDAVVLGSAVYVGKWLSSAADFLQKHETELARRPVWLFSSGPTGEGDPKALMKGWEFPEALRPIASRIKPRGVTVFSGKLDSSSLNFFTRILVKAINAASFRIGDFRDWDMIRLWAGDIARALSSEAHPVALS